MTQIRSSSASSISSPAARGDERADSGGGADSGDGAAHHGSLVLPIVALAGGGGRVRQRRGTMLAIAESAAATPEATNAVSVLSSVFTMESHKAAYAANVFEKTGPRDN